MKSNLYEKQNTEYGARVGALVSKRVMHKKSGNFVDKACMNIILDLFLSMKTGLLNITLPDGSTVSNHGSEDSVSCDISISDYSFFNRCVMFGPIGFAEAYIDGMWTTENLTDVIRWFINNADQSTVMEGSSKRSNFLDLFQIANRLAHILRPNTKSIGKKNISAHYDLSNEMFELFLDPSMTYSSGIFDESHLSLEEAQANKYEKLCQSLNLKTSDQVLEIGCGWGGFASYAAKNYGCRITAITISERQYEYAKQRMENEGLTDLVSIKLIDYRDMVGQFDKIVSIEMVEALGDRNVDNFFSQCSRLLTKNGLISIQMISSADSRYEQLRTSVDFIQKHIFPGSLLLSIERVVRATARVSDLQILELNDYGESYAHTLKLWRSNFIANLNKVRALGFDQSFIRKWIYYFCYCEAAFDTRQISVLQLTLSRPNNRFLSEERRIKG